MPGLKAQDIHFSQYYNSPLNLNPALTGIFNGDYRFMGIYRNQWTTVPVDYRTFSAGFDMKYIPKKMDTGFFGGGIILKTDEAGDSELGLSQVSLNVAYSQLLNENNVLTIGYQFGTGQRSFNLENLRFGNQHNGDIFLETEDSRENFSNTGLNYIDMSAGINWHLQFETGLKQLDLGASLSHLNRPEQSFYNSSSVQLPMKYSLYAIGEIMINDRLSTIIHALGMGQGGHNEGAFGLGAKYWLNQQRGKEMALTFGTAYRYIGANDAVIPSIELQYLTWKFGLSYDINLSGFEVATNKRGGVEMSLIYIITKVPPTKEFKACPIF